MSIYIYTYRCVQSVCSNFDEASIISTLGMIDPPGSSGSLKHCRNPKGSLGIPRDWLPLPQQKSQEITIKSP